MIATNTTIEPGIYHHVEFDKYKSWAAMNMSTLLWGRTSMQHMKAAIDGLLNKESDALNFGRALHHYILERDTFDIHWQLAQSCDAVLKSGDSKGETCGKSGTKTDGEFWRCGTHAKGLPGFKDPENCITRNEMDDILSMANALKGHPVVKLLRQRGGCEASAMFEVRGVPCKCRLDKLIANEKFPTIIDLKTVRSGWGERDKFQKHIYDYDYAIRAAFYVDAVKQLKGYEPSFIWVVVEDSAPFAVGVYQCDPHTLAWGRFMYETLIGSYKNALSTGVWSGYTTKIEELGLPQWVFKRFEGALETVQ